MVRNIHHSCCFKPTSAVHRVCGRHFFSVVASLLVFALAQYLRYDLHKLNDAGSNMWWAYPDTQKSVNSGNFENAVAKKIKESSHSFKLHHEQTRKLIVWQENPYQMHRLAEVNEKICGRCEVSYNTTLRDTADAVIYDFNIIDRNRVYRSFEDQLLIWMSIETPWTTLNNYKRDFEGYDDQFNLTMTYRRDADIYFPYSYIADIEKTKSKSEENSPVSKTKLVAWVVGDCLFTKGARQRLEMVKKLLQLGLDIDISGTCVLHTIPGDWLDLAEHLSQYKFYLSFENALHCRDYITEKTWWNALHSGAVPVIWGPKRSDVEAVLPKNSFLFVEDFSHPKDLVEKLQSLDTSPKEYSKFFDWQKVPAKAKPQQLTGYCQLCLMLHADEHIKSTKGIRPSHRVESLREVWYEREDAVCMTTPKPFEIPHAVYQWCAFFLEYYFHAILWRRFYAVIFIFVLTFIIWRRLKSSK